MRLFQHFGLGPLTLECPPPGNTRRQIGAAATLIGGQGGQPGAQSETPTLDQVTRDTIIATGFYRTGTPWAGDACEVTPDILCVGKALTGGTLPLAATVASRRVSVTPLQVDMTRYTALETVAHWLDGMQVDDR